MNARNTLREAATGDRPLPSLPPSKVRWRILLSNRTAAVGMGLALVFFATALFAPWIAPFDPLAQDLKQALLPPNGTHLLGTDPYGRDELSRVIHGARLSCLIGMVAVIMGTTLGVTFGLTAGYLGGRSDNIISRLIDVMLAFPSMLLAILLIAIIGQGTVNVMVAIGIYAMPTYTRLVRASVMSLKGSEFIEAAVSSGSSTPRVLARHILPNTLGPIIVQSTFLFGTAIRLASGLSFLGIGVPAPIPEWGSMLADARAYIGLTPRLIIVPGSALMTFILGFNLFGDGLRDFLDPKTRY